MAQRVLDEAHSRVQFKIKHMAISTVTGSFDRFDATLETATVDSFDKAKVDVNIHADSINTGVEKRDEHLRADETLFDVKKYPRIRFVSTGLEQKSENEYIMTGDLTIKDITKSVSLDIEFGGILRLPEQGTRLGATATTSILKDEYGITFNAPLGAGKLLLGNEVMIEIAVEFILED